MGENSNYLEDNLVKDKKAETITDMIFYRKQSPSTGQQKVRGKRCAPKKWSDKETRLFYKGLEMFGTDFSLIETLFSTRNKKQLLRKYHKEKKKNPTIIQETLHKHGTNVEKKLAHYGLNLDERLPKFDCSRPFDKASFSSGRKLGDKTCEIS